MRKAVLAGGSGYIGSVLANHLIKEFDDIVILSRASQEVKNKIRSVKWDGKNPDVWIDELDGAELLVNLAGKNVNCRYNEKNKKEILESRLNATNVLAQAINTVKVPPKTWIQMASATIYRRAEDRPMNETTGEIGDGFSIDVCKKWEQIFWESKCPNTRKVLLRTSIVLGPTDGVFPRVLNLVKYGLGGKQGNGKQMVSWIHDQDLARMVSWINDNEKMEGTFNATSPSPVSNKVLMTTLRRLCKIPFGLPSPAWLLELGALMIGTETELVLKSRWVVPSRLLEEGFVFQFSTLESALKDILALKNQNQQS